jgi:hypothetical protein
MLPSLVALMLFKTRWAVVAPASFMHEQTLSYLFTAARWEIPLRVVGARLLMPSPQWPLAWWPVILAVLVAALAPTRRWTARSLPLLLVPLAALGVFLLIFVITPYDQSWHVSGSIDRLLLQLYPSALLGALVTLSFVGCQKNQL